MTNFADVLIQAIREKGNPCVVGLDYHEKLLPDFVSNALRERPDPEGYREIIGGFFKRIIDIVAPLVPAVKPQMALLEGLTWVGAQIFMDIVQLARERGLVVIADAKRSDIASSASGYADAFLGAPGGPAFARGYDAHAVTVNPFLGRDSLEPFVEACRSRGKGIFILVRTSNKGSRETQEVILEESGRPVFATYAKMVQEIGEPLLGAGGYSSVGAVVGATFPDQARQLRKLMPRAIILVPGYGAQGASADDAVLNFNDDGLGAIVNASRSITYQFHRPDISPQQYQETVKANVERMIADILAALKRRGLA